MLVWKTRNGDCHQRPALCTAQILPDRAPPGVEGVGVAPRDVDVGPAELDRLGDPGALVELVPGLDRDDLAPGGERGCPLPSVAGTAGAVGQQAAARALAVA